MKKIRYGDLCRCKKKYLKISNSLFQFRRGQRVLSYHLAHSGNLALIVHRMLKAGPFFSHIDYCNSNK